MSTKKQKSLCIDEHGKSSVVGDRIADFRNKVFELIHADKEASNYEKAMAVTCVLGAIVAANTLSMDHALSMVQAYKESLTAEEEKENQ